MQSLFYPPSLQATRIFKGSLVLYLKTLKILHTYCVWNFTTKKQRDLTCHYRECKAKFRNCYWKWKLNCILALGLLFSSIFSNISTLLYVLTLFPFKPPILDYEHMHEWLGAHRPSQRKFKVWIFHSCQGGLQWRRDKKCRAIHQNYRSKCLHSQELMGILSVIMRHFGHPPSCQCPLHSPLPIPGIPCRQSATN